LSKFGRFGLTYKNFYRIIPMAKSAVWVDIHKNLWF
jgi:hypothetical protein